MTTYPYIVLTNSNASLSRRFKAIAMGTPLLRTDSVELTAGGKTDKATGPVIQAFQYALRVPIDDPADANYGNYAELKTFFSYDSAITDPTDVITLTDHFGDDYDCYFYGQLDPEPLTTMLEGPNAWMVVQINMREVT